VLPKRVQKKRDDGSYSGPLSDAMLREQNAELATTEERIARIRDQLWGAKVAELEKELAKGNSDE
jgi:hypothetical protein